MNKYESVIIVNPNLDEAGVKALEDKFTVLAKTGICLTYSNLSYI